jgi:adenylate cyclase
MAASIVACGLSILPAVQAWEEDLGLSWLYHTRGVTPSPQAVVVVSIDKSSSKHFGLPNLARKWPRSLHARLLDRLRQAEARLVTFDIHFRVNKNTQDDQLLAKSIRDFGDVILFSFLQKNVVDAVDDQGRMSLLVIDELIPPLGIFADAAAILAPNPLPKVPVKVSQFWKFVPEAGDAPTLPVVSYQLYHEKLLHEFVQRLSTTTKHTFDNYKQSSQWSRTQFADLMRNLRELFVQDKDLALRMQQDIDQSAMTAEKRRDLNNILKFYAGPASQYLNYYGPARSIKTIPFYQVLESDEVLATLKDKLVFVGFSEHRQWEQQDGFYSVYSNEEGLDISGVEITATAAANLIDGIAVKPTTLGMRFVVLLIFAAVLVLIFRKSHGPWLPVSLMLAAGLYFLIAWQWFVYDGCWLPLVVPLLVQLPMVMLAGMSWNYQELNRQRKNIQRAFGYYLPEVEVNRLARDITDHGLGGKLMHGICLSTDAQQYTRLSEKMPPQQLSTFMNEYYEAIFKPVRRHSGIISDVVGDCVMALWANPAGSQQQREQAVDAAIEIMHSVEHFNQRHQDNVLPTRIGLHYGAMVIGNVGAVDHYEYRAVGDIVNTTSRIEGMNKYLGINLLASADVIEGLDSFDSRCVGLFILKGKSVALPLYEIGARDVADRAGREQCWHLFGQALTQFQHGQWAEAGQAFDNILKSHPQEGPSRFYRNYCENNKFTPPENWRGVINMQDK